MDGVVNEKGELPAKVLLKEQAGTAYNGVHQRLYGLDVTVTRIDGCSLRSTRVKAKRSNGVQEVPSSNLGAPIS